jgi:putative membrane protein
VNHKRIGKPCEDPVSAIYACGVILDAVPSLGAPWEPQPLVLALAAVAAVCFFRGFAKLRRRGRTDHAPINRAVLFVLGLAVLVLPLVSPLDELGDRYLLSAHMLQHVLIADAAPALLLVALRGPLLLFAVPAALLRALGHSPLARSAGGFVGRPLVALTAWALAFGVWHIPALYDYAASHPTVHALEHTSMILAGFMVWALLVDPARRHHLSRAQKLAVIAGLFALGTVIADVLIFSLHPLYPAYATEPYRVFGLSPLHDQQLAGIVMMIEQVLTLGTCAAILLIPELRRRRKSQALVGRQQPA